MLATASLVLPICLAMLIANSAPARAWGSVCDVRIHNPHVSSTNSSYVIAKGDGMCTSQIDLLEMTLVLFRCPNPPSGPEVDWYSQGCANVDEDTWTIPSPTVNYRYYQYPTANRKIQVKFIPAPRQYAYYVACNTWTEIDNSEVTYQDTRVSAVEWLATEYPDDPGDLILP